METKSVAFVPGTWDLFHVGHLNLITQASKLCQHTIVGVSTDELVFSYKNHFPLVPFKERYEIVRSLRCVSEVVTQSELLSINQMIELHMDVLVLGSDWESSDLPGIQWARENRQVIIFPRTEGISSTSLKHRIREQADAN